MRAISRESAATLIEKVLTGEMTSSMARDLWPQPKGDSLLDQAYHLLYHFEDDTDIRARDSKYREWQTALMRKLVLQLRCEQN